MTMASCTDHAIAACETASRKVNSHLRQLCELTYRCLQTIDSDDPDALATILDQRQARMAEIDRLQDTPSSLAAESVDPEDAHHLEIERRDLLNLLNSLDGELIRLSTQKRDDLRAAFQKILTHAAGPATGRDMAGRLFSRIG